MHGRRADSSKKQKGRLPAIAPKDEQAVPSSAPQTPASRASPTNTFLGRTRLPPRSRTGCWTCRTRKVKCDEGHPTCGQCARLQHRCDYSPRLSFRDDTPRIVERMQEVSITEGSVWNPQPPSRASSNGSSSPEDVLPPFASLTNDEDREKKAEHQNPGTFHVVVNPDSFSALPEYNDGDCGTEVDPNQRGQSQTGREGSLDTEVDRSSQPELEQDPNVVILRRFDDTARRATSLYPRTSSKSPSSSTPSRLLASPSTEDFNRPSVVPSHESRSGSISPSRQEQRLLEHYRNFISGQLSLVLQDDEFQTISSRGAKAADAFEREAASFPPLFHAIIALSSLSYTYNQGLQSVDALQHYQQALPSLQNTLKSPRDLSSNGALFANFFLLLYEIAAAERWGSSLWMTHLGQLLRILMIRRETFGNEPHALMIWFVSVIDIYALLSASGNGYFADTIIKNDMLPVSDAYMHSPINTATMMPQFFEPVMRLNQHVLSLALRLGQLARDIRSVTASQQFTADAFMRDRSNLRIINWLQGLAGIQRNLRSAWANDMSSCMAARDASNGTWSHTVQAIFDHTCLLYWASIIYSHTSMWPSQCAQASPQSEDEIGHAVRSILNLSKTLIPAKQLELRFVILPLFMAGFAATAGDEKVLALELIAMAERESIGRNTPVARSLLQDVCQRQNEALMNVGHMWEVDWVDIMGQRGLQGVKFGL